MGKESGFQLALVKILFQREEIEQIGVFQRLLNQIGIGWWQAQGKIAGRVAPTPSGLWF